MDIGERIVNILLECLVYCKAYAIILGIVIVVYLLATIIGRAHYKITRNKQFPCETCENADCVSNESPCYSCYDKSEYKGREDKEEDNEN